MAARAISNGRHKWSRETATTCWRKSSGGCALTFQTPEKKLASGGRFPTRSNQPFAASKIVSILGNRRGLDEAENCPLHALVTLRKCSTLYNFPTNSSFNTT